MSPGISAARAVSSDAVSADPYRLLSRLPKTTFFDALKPLLARAHDLPIWDDLTRHLGRWERETPQDDPDARASLDTLDGFLDAVLPDAARVAPAAWWNAAQDGAAPRAWRLVRLVRTEQRHPKERFSPCQNPDALHHLTEIDSDDVQIPLRQLAHAPKLLRLRYRYESLRFDQPVSLEGLETLRSLRRLELVLTAGVDDFSPLAKLAGLESLTLDVSGATPVAPLDLRPLGGHALRALQVGVLSPHDGAAVILAPLSELASLVLDPTPDDLTAIAAAPLKHLELHRAATLNPRVIPTTVTALTLGGYGHEGLDALDHLAHLESLTLHACHTLTALDTTYLPALRHVTLSDCPRLARIELGPASALSSVKRIP